MLKHFGPLSIRTRWTLRKLALSRNELSFAIEKDGFVVYTLVQRTEYRDDDEPVYDDIDISLGLEEWFLNQVASRKRVYCVPAERAVHLGPLLGSRNLKQ